MASFARLRIDFQVQELVPEGQDPATARHVTFGDEVDISAIKDFFERCGIATDILFSGTPRAKVIRLGPGSSPFNKIGAIKLLRALTNIGLKDAKDVIEGQPGSPCVVFRDGRDADRAMADFHKIGVMEMVCDNCDFDALVKLNVPQYMPPSMI